MKGSRVARSSAGGSNKPNKKKKKGRSPLIGIGAAAGVLLAGYLGLCGWVSASGKILPNVDVAGVDVSGLTQEEARTRLEQTVGEKASEAAVVLQYGGWSQRVDAQSLQADEAGVQGALDVGRENFLTGGSQFLSHLLGAGTHVTLAAQLSEAGTAQLNQLLDEADAAEWGNVTGYTYSVEGDQLNITKGVTGMAIQREEALELVRQSLVKSMEASLAGNPAEETVELPAQESAPQEPDFDAMYQELHTEVKDAVMDDSGQITDEVIGVDYDPAEAKSLFDAAGEGETVAVPLTLTYPDVTRGRLEGKLFLDLLGEGTSRVGGSANRKNNVKLSAAACNGVILMPGEEFSYNNTTGSRSADKGYLPAPIYVGGQSESGVGGGICQTSSTIYYAVLHTTLKVTERHAHQFAVGYVPDGMDATVYYGSLDFRFKNTTSAPIKIVTETYDKNGSRYLTVKIYGTNDTGRYAVPERIQYDWIQPTTQYKADSSVPRGTTKKDTQQYAYTGLKAQTYRYIYEKDGTLVEKQDMGVSSYKMRPTTILYNPADGSPDGSKPASTTTVQPTTPETSAEVENPVTTPDTSVTPETPAETPVTPETPAETPAETETSAESDAPASQDIPAEPSA